MRFSAIFRPLASPAVAPLPIRTIFDQQVNAELDTLQRERAPESDSDHLTHSSASWLLAALDASISTQKIALQSLSNVTFTADSDRKAVEAYLDDDSIELLDNCNDLSERIEVVRKYLESLKVVSHLLDGQVEPSAMALSRAQDLLESCGEAMERRCREMEKCGFGLRRLLSQKGNGGASASSSSELSEILGGSKAVALMACKFVGSSLSFKSKRGVLKRVQSYKHMTATWLSSLHELQKQLKAESDLKKHRRCHSSNMMLTELRSTVSAARDLRDKMKSRKQNNKLGVAAVEELKRRCGELEEGIDLLDCRVKELYKHLICFRMALLGILSQA